MRAVPLFLIAVTVSPSLVAQAWLPAKGDGSTTVLYQNDIERLHAFGDGRIKDKGHTTLDGIILDTDFALSDRWAVRVSVPFIEGKYLGSSPHDVVRGDPSTEVAIDNGHYHGGIQDLRFNVRYALSRRSLMITPFFQASIPSNRYPTLGHAAVGFDEQEYRAGVNIGRRLNPILPNAFVQGMFAMAFTPEVADHVAPKRTYSEVQLGYLLGRHFALQGSSVLLYSLNGINFDYNLFPNNLTVEQYLNHDRIAQGKLLDASGSLNYQINRSTNFFVSLGHSFWGTNTHLRYLVTTIGFTKAFSTKWSAEKSSAFAVLPEAAKATVCTCAKK